MSQKPSIPKGTRDFNPSEVAKRHYIINTIKSKFERFGFQPIETPSFENSKTLMGKYGDEGDRLIFKILDSGDFLKSLDSEIFQYSKYTHQLKATVIDLARKIESIFDNYDESDYETFRKNAPLDKAFQNEIKFYKELAFRDTENDYYKNLYLTYSNLKEEIIKEAFQILERKKINVIENRQQNEIEELNGYEVSDHFLTSIYNTIYKFSFDPSNISKRISSKALRYDLTVPFARYVVQHQNDIEFPFKRYQIQPVWRADRPQKGRFREFYQCDADVVGSQSLWQEVEFVQLYDSVFSALNLEGVIIKINNRKILSGIAEVIGAQDKLIDFTVALDKLDKIGEEKVKEDMRSKGIPEEGIEKLQPLFQVSGSFKDQIKELKSILDHSEVGMKGIEELEFINAAIDSIGLKTAKLQLDVTLARGLNYYTGAIFEVSAPEGVQMGSIGGGGRYDDLTGIFGMKDMSGVGISFGLDRIYLVMEELGLFPASVEDSVKVLFINFGDQESLASLKAIKRLREHGISAELFPDNKKTIKQFNYANKRNIPYVVLLGESELKGGTFALKNMKTGDQKSVTINELMDALK